MTIFFTGMYVVRPIYLPQVGGYIYWIILILITLIVCMSDLDFSSLIYFLNGVLLCFSFPMSLLVRISISTHGVGLPWTPESFFLTFKTSDSGRNLLQSSPKWNLWAQRFMDLEMPVLV